MNGKSRRHLVVTAIVLAVLAAGLAGAAIVLSGNADGMHELLAWLPVFAALGVMLTACFMLLMRRSGTRARGEQGLFDRRPLRVNPSTGLRTDGAIDRGGSTYGTGRDDNERRTSDA